MSSSVDIGGMRKPYLDGKNTFDLPDLSSREPFGQFQAWFDEASKHDLIEEPNAMCIATASKEGRPSARMVLLKEFGAEEGFVFYTNYGSRKGQELAENPFAALMFYWEPLKKSVRVEGRVERVSREKSEAYFQSRPFGSQIGAAVSDQSEVITDRKVLESKESELRSVYGGEDGKTLAKPECWGGYRIVPDTFEFWQGQSTRIHDRLRFRKPAQGEKTLEDPAITEGEKGWVIERLSP